LRIDGRSAGAEERQNSIHHDVVNLGRGRRKINILGELLGFRCPKLEVTARVEQAW
jgi:hypothetical protein